MRTTSESSISIACPYKKGILIYNIVNEIFLQVNHSSSYFENRTDHSSVSEPGHWMTPPDHSHDTDSSCIVGFIF